MGFVNPASFLFFYFPSGVKAAGERVLSGFKQATPTRCDVTARLQVELIWFFSPAADFCVSLKQQGGQNHVDPSGDGGVKAIRDRKHKACLFSGPGGTPGPLLLLCVGGCGPPLRGPPLRTPLWSFLPTRPPSVRPSGQDFTWTLTGSLAAWLLFVCAPCVKLWRPWRPRRRQHTAAAGPAAQLPVGLHSVGVLQETKASIL
ncbi:uncharacterized protein LOC103475294 [Poecilia reticulata]|uniref:uncharacterized protein LOC103475294 n=1 Tax=Poecilia reticulata TaxID=8081 RepID=UPI0004A29498|nr:PREDICTED: uncharacterized protein LOC103475294 [Poecilia reticulata]